jgi:dephospho-CoA kinase
VVEAIKLVEGGLAELCDGVWLITCDPAAQAARLRARGVDDADATARVAAQGDVESRLRERATRVIDTSGSLAATRAAADESFGLAVSRTA